MPEIIHYLSNKATLTGGYVSKEQIPPNIASGALRFAVSLTPQAIVAAVTGNRPPGWGEEDCDPPVLSLIANVTPRWDGYFGSSPYTSVPSGFVQVQAGLRIAYADTNKVGVSATLTTPVNINLTKAPDGQQFIYADFDTEGNIVKFGYAPSNSTIKTFKMPPFTGYTLENWGTISGSYDDGGSKSVWKAFDSSDSTYWRNNGELPSTLTLKLTTQRTLFGYLINPRSYNESPRSWQILVDGKVVDTQTNVTSWASAGLRVALNTPTRGSEITLKVTDTNGYRVSLYTLQPIFRAADWYDEPSKTMFSDTNEVIRRTYIGYAVVESGSVVNVHSYSLGSETFIPVNKGNNVYTDQNFIEPPPYLEYDAIGGIYSVADDEWYQTGQGIMTMDSLSNTLTVSVDENKNGLLVKSDEINLAALSYYLRNYGDSTTSIPSKCRVRVTKKS